MGIIRRRLLIIGKTPPPVGGVTIHIQRLTDNFRKEGIEFILLDYKNIRQFYKFFLPYNLVHIHLSNKIWRMVLTLFLRILGKKVIITFHGNYNFQNFFDRTSLLYSSANILLNRGSFDKANLYSSKNHFLSSFIAPTRTNKPLSVSVTREILQLREHSEILFCMNASNYVVDKNGNDIYQGEKIINFFSRRPAWGLIFSDPSGYYSKQWKSKYHNCIFINETHDFISVIKQSDCLLRYTTTDGDSLSVKEALYIGVPVIASDCVERPSGVLSIKEISELDDIIADRRYTSLKILKPSESYKSIKRVLFCYMN